MHRTSSVAAALSQHLYFGRSMFNPNKHSLPWDIIALLAVALIVAACFILTLAFAH